MLHRFPGSHEENNDLNRATDEFIAALLKSEIYKTYRINLQKVKEQPELKGQIDEFRRRNFDLQTSADIDFDKLDQFEKEYENFREQPLVADFLAAELDFCKLMQGIYARVIEEIDFQ